MWEIFEKFCRQDKMQLEIRDPVERKNVKSPGVLEEMGYLRNHPGFEKTSCGK